MIISRKGHKNALKCAVARVVAVCAPLALGEPDAGVVPPELLLLSSVSLITVSICLSLWHAVEPAGSSDQVQRAARRCRSSWAKKAGVGAATFPFGCQGSRWFFVIVIINSLSSFVYIFLKSVSLKFWIDFSRSYLSLISPPLLGKRNCDNLLGS